MQLRAVSTLGIVPTLSLCAVLLFAQDQLRSVGSEEAPPHARQLARLIAAHELVKHHAGVFETDPNLRALLVEMCDELSRSTDVGFTWSGRHLAAEVNNADKELNEFERFAIRRLSESNSPPEMWKGDGTWYVRAFTAEKHKDCARCHKAFNDGPLIGFVSIEFKKPLWK
jgi:hypothetical protein